MGAQKSRVALIVGAAGGALALVATVAVIAVRSRRGGPETQPSVAPPAAEPGGVWAKEVLAATGPDGRVTKEGALKAFALSYGPVPGVAVPAADADVPFCGSDVHRMLAPHYEGLPPEQKLAVARGMGALKGGAAGAATRHQLGGGGLIAPTSWIDLLAAIQRDEMVDPAPERRQHVEAAVQEARRFIEPHSPVGTPFAIQIYYSRQYYLGSYDGVNRPRTGAEAFIIPSPNVPNHAGERTCHIRVSSWASDPTSGKAGRAALIHEVFHCYQYATFQGRHAEWSSLPGWVTEGAAAWVGETAVGGGDGYFANSWMGYYLRSNSYPLLAGSYDAIGFYEAMARQGVDVWPRMFAALRIGVDNDARFAQFVGSDVAKLDVLASGPVRNAAWGAAWTYESPLVPSLLSGTKRWLHPPHTRQPRSLPIALAAEPGEQKVEGLELRGVDLVKLSGTGSGHLVVNGLHDRRFNPRLDVVYCVTQRCACPDGRNPFGVAPLRVQGTEMTLAMTGLPSLGASILVDSASLDDACTQTPDAGAPLPSAIDPCLVGRWRLDTTHAKAQYAARLARGGVLVEGIRGGQELEIQANRTFSHRMLPMVVLARIPAASEMAVEFGGTASGTAGSYGGTPAGAAGCRSRGIVGFTRVASDLAVRYRVRVGLHGLDEDRSLADAVQPGRAHYFVTPSRLVLTPDVDEGIEAVYTR